MSETSIPFWTRRRLILFGLVLAAVSVTMPSVVRKGSELKVYALAANRLLAGEQIYRTDDKAAFTYPPFFALPFVPLEVFPKTAKAMVWWFVNLSLLAAIITIVAQLASPIIQQSAERGGPSARLCWIMVAVFSARFLISPFEYQSHDLIVLLAVLLCARAWVAGREGRSGAWAGLATACKATPLLLLPLFLVQRRFVAATALMITLIAATLLPDLLFTNPAGEPWAATWVNRFVAKVGIAQAPEAEGAWAAWNPLNQSMAGTMHRLSTPVKTTARTVNVALWHLEGGQLKAICLIAQLSVLAALLAAAWPRKALQQASPPQRQFYILGQVGAVLCGMLLLSPMSSSQHFCALFVPITFCLVYWLCERRDKWLTVLLVVILLTGSLAAKDIITRSLANPLQAFGGKTWATVACLLASVRVMILLARSAEESFQSFPLRIQADSRDARPAIAVPESYKKAA